MSRPKDDLIQQLDRIPLNRFLRQEATAGVEALSDAEAQDKAAELAVALGRLPDLLERLRDERRYEAGQQEGSSAPTAGPERTRGPAGAMADLGSLREYRERFSEPAKSAARAAVRDYTRDLIEISLACQEVNRRDAVSELDVQAAYRFLNRKTKDDRKEFWGLLGGILLGGGLSVFLSMLLGEGYSPAKGLIGTMLAVLLTLFVAWLLGSRQPVLRHWTSNSARSRHKALSVSELGSAADGLQAARGGREARNKGKREKVARTPGSRPAPPSGPTSPSPWASTSSSASDERTTPSTR